MPRARRQAATAQLWWVENRTAAPTMLRDELARVISLLARHPELGIQVRGHEIRRLLLPDTEQFIYYRVRHRARRIEILALWVRVDDSGRRCRLARCRVEHAVSGA
jgi:plasmid stabilization system protein ParE